MFFIFALVNVVGVLVDVPVFWWRLFLSTLLLPGQWRQQKFKLENVCQALQKMAPKRACAAIQAKKCVRLLQAPTGILKIRVLLSQETVVNPAMVRAASTFHGRMAAAVSRR
jgi:hypothetical protein